MRLIRIENDKRNKYYLRISKRTCLCNNQSINRISFFKVLISFCLSNYFYLIKSEIDTFEQKQCAFLFYLNFKI